MTGAKSERTRTQEREKGKRRGSQQDALLKAINNHCAAHSRIDARSSVSRTLSSLPRRLVSLSFSYLYFAPLYLTLLRFIYRLPFQGLLESNRPFARHFYSLFNLFVYISLLYILFLPQFSFLCIAQSIPISFSIFF